jgi:YVTN family beta-propeller protein
MKKLPMAVNQGLGCLVILAVVGVVSLAVGAMKVPATRVPLSATAPPTTTPSPALLVLNKGENALAIVDPGTFKVVAKVPTGPVPHEVAVSSNGKLAFVTNYGPHQDGTSLSVIDLVSQTELHRVDLGALRGPHGIVFFDGKAWFTVEGSRMIARYDPATNKIDWTQEIGQNRTHMLLISKDGRTIYTANVESNSVSVLDKGTDSKSWSITNIAVGKGPEGMDLSPDGKELWAANSHDGTVSIIDTATKKVTQTVDVKTKFSNRVKFVLDGKLVLITDLASGDLLVMDTATRKEIKRLQLGKSTEGILIAPDGLRAFVALSSDNKLAVLDLKNLTVSTTFTTGEDPDGMAWVN